MATGTEMSALERLLRPLARGLTAELARALVNMRADEETQARYDELASKRTEGQLTPPEQVELEAIVRANTLLGVLKAEARTLLTARQTSCWNESEMNTGDRLRWRELLLRLGLLE